nr:immunoglobulin heavy chain junction region [Macaca mulatta]MOW89612.1 immunoglobulin heavy chain junction region [Macaca mulatta]MOW92270.1 immunoglobulin heavy chain junction region [Macaca mulatta]MOW93081.1 immunoglobulin heavy chain junction region [Macaca mulatta]
CVRRAAGIYGLDSW